MSVSATGQNTQSSSSVNFFSNASLMRHMSQFLTVNDCARGMGASILWRNFYQQGYKTVSYDFTSEDSELIRYSYELLQKGLFFYYNRNHQEKTDDIMKVWKWLSEGSQQSQWPHKEKLRDFFKGVRLLSLGTPNKFDHTIPRIRYRVLQNLQLFPRLRTLNFLGCGGFTKEAAFYFDASPQLEALTLGNLSFRLDPQNPIYYDFDDEALKELAGRLKNLSVLYVYGCRPFTGSGLGAFSSLEHLRLQNCSTVTSAGLSQLPQSLQSLTLANLNITNQVAENLPLSLRKIVFINCPVTNEILDRLDAYPKLKIDQKNDFRNCPSFTKREMDFEQVSGCFALLKGHLPSHALVNFALSSFNKRMPSIHNRIVELAEQYDIRCSQENDKSHFLTYEAPRDKIISIAQMVETEYLLQKLAFALKIKSPKAEELLQKLTNCNPGVVQKLGYVLEAERVEKFLAEYRADSPQVRSLAQSLGNLTLSE